MMLSYLELLIAAKKWKMQDRWRLKNLLCQSIDRSVLVLQTKFCLEISYGISKHNYQTNFSNKISELNIQTIYPNKISKQNFQRSFQTKQKLLVILRGGL